MLLGSLSMLLVTVVARCLCCYGHVAMDCLAVANGMPMLFIAILHSMIILQWIAKP